MQNKTKNKQNQANIRKKPAESLPAILNSHQRNKDYSVGATLTRAEAEEQEEGPGLHGLRVLVGPRSGVAACVAPWCCLAGLWAARRMWEASRASGAIVLHHLLAAVTAELSSP